MDSKNILNIFYPFIDSLNQGSFIRKLMTNLFRLIGILSLVGGLYFFFKTISNAPDFWFVLLLILFLAFTFVAFQIWFYRADAISKLKDSDFNVIPIFANVFRGIGETYAAFLITIGIGGTINLWFSSYSYSLMSFLSFVPFISADSSFLGGILFLLMTIVMGLSILLFTYFLAENVLVLVEIARNTRSLRKED
ncbi:MAG TPA: hypothetical protein VKA26_13685 [Ignavibacteriaceae bacterium]|nr:hypothetical protein [Ignavibacteriaceae bacterium]